ncbi:hypothetical protein H1R20_g3730, partial [Candolleomyces eurysporus]
MALPFPVSKRQPDPTTTPPISGSSSPPSDTTTEKQPSPLQSPQPIDIESQPGPTVPQQPKPPRLARLPTWISFWLGYRKVTPPPEKKHVVWIWSFIGAFTCIASIQALFGNVPFFVEKGVPSIGATAVLLYGAIESPLSQPRPVLGGHLVGAFVGIVITKLFLLLPTEQRFDELCWLAGSLCCALAIVLMQMTGTMHPPAGATALLAAVSPDIRRIGWLYLPVVLLASSIALVVALLCNNMQRRYPTFWWTPPPTIAPSFFPTLPLSRTLTKTLTWTSRSRTLNGSKASKKRGKKGASGDSVPVADKDWHYALKNHSKIFGSGRAGSIISRSGSRSRESSRTRNGRPRPLSCVSPNDNSLHASNLPSALASPRSTHPATPMSLSPPASAAVSRRPSMDNLHVEFQVQPMHHHLHGQGHGHVSPRHSHHHHHHHSNYLRYLAMKREGTLSATASGAATPTDSVRISRSTSADALNVLPLARPHSTHHALVANERAHQEQHAQQLIEAVAVAKLERDQQERKDKELAQKEQDAVAGEDQWEDIGEAEEQDLAECEGVVIQRSDKKRAGGTV